MIRAMDVVMDASVAIAIARVEPEGPRAEEAIERITRQGGRLLVPPHFWFEVVNALIRRHRWSGSDTLEAIHDLDRLQMETIDLDRALVVMTIDAAERHGLSSYDAAYVALAISLDASLATFDRALRRAAGDRAIDLGDDRIAETSVPYERPVTWPDYKEASAFLAELRTRSRPAASP